MKKTLMLFALFLLITVAGNAQSTYPIQDTVAAIAPHVPTVHRFAGSGKPWYNGVESTYTHATEDTVVAWIAAYPSESALFYTKVNTYLTTTDPSTLSTGEGELYKDLHSIWIMIHAND